MEGYGNFELLKSELPGKNLLLVWIYGNVKADDSSRLNCYLGLAPVLDLDTLEDNLTAQLSDGNPVLVSTSVVVQMIVGNDLGDRSGFCETPGALSSTRETSDSLKPAERGQSAISFASRITKFVPKTPRTSSSSTSPGMQLSARPSRKDQFERLIQRR